MCYNVPLYFERKNIKISDIFYLTRQNPHTIITFSSGESIATTIPIKELILAAGMTQSMSRVARCIDNGPMEGFWGLMKREMYYGKKYKTKEELMLAIEKYIDYYTNKRVQRNLEVLTPLEFHEQKLENVA